jgi:methionine biosynthesis protein MetW
MSSQPGYTNHLCPVCKGTEHAHFHTVKRHEVVRCKSCQFMFVLTTPSEEKLSEFYRKAYRKGYLTETGEYKARGSFHRNLKLQAFRFMMRWWQRKAKTINLLEIGCGQGDLLASVQHDPKFEAQGIDLAEQPLAYAASRGLRVERTDLESRRFEDNTFDMIVAMHVMEHVQNPERLITEIRRILKPGGMYFAVLPCSSHIKARLAGVNWRYLTPPQHLWYFTPKTLSRFVERLGLKTVFSSSIYHRAHVHYLAEKPATAVEQHYPMWMGDASPHRIAA